MKSISPTLPPQAAEKYASGELQAAGRGAAAELRQTAATGREWYDHLAGKYGAT